MAETAPASGEVEGLKMAPNQADQQPMTNGAEIEVSGEAPSVNKEQSTSSLSAHLLPPLPPSSSSSASASSTLKRRRKAKNSANSPQPPSQHENTANDHQSISRPKCVVHGCTINEKADQSEVTFHDFPVVPAIRAKWLANIGAALAKGQWGVPTGGSVCSRHFVTECFQKSPGPIHALGSNSSDLRHQRAAPYPPSGNPSRHSSHTNLATQPAPPSRILHPSAFPTKKMGVGYGLLPHRRFKLPPRSMSVAPIPRGQAPHTSGPALPPAGAPYPRGTVSANVSACNSRSGTLRRRGKKSGSLKDKDKRQSTGSLSGIVVNGESSGNNSAAPSMNNLNLAGTSAAAIATNGERNCLTNGNDVPSMANGQSNFENGNVSNGHVTEVNQSRPRLNDALTSRLDDDIKGFVNGELTAGESSHEQQGEVTDLTKNDGTLMGQEKDSVFFDQEGAKSEVCISKSSHGDHEPESHATSVKTGNEMDQVHQENDSRPQENGSAALSTRNTDSLHDLKMDKERDDEIKECFSTITSIASAVIAKNDTAQDSDNRNCDTKLADEKPGSDCKDIVNDQECGVIASQETNGVDGQNVISENDPNFFPTTKNDDQTAESDFKAPEDSDGVSDPDDMALSSTIESQASQELNCPQSDNMSAPDPHDTQLSVVSQPEEPILSAQPAPVIITEPPITHETSQGESAILEVATVGEPEVPEPTSVETIETPEHKDPPLNQEAIEKLTPEQQVGTESSLLAETEHIGPESAPAVESVITMTAPDPHNTQLSVSQPEEPILSAQPAPVIITESPITHETSLGESAILEVATVGEPEVPEPTSVETIETPEHKDPPLNQEAIEKLTPEQQVGTESSLLAETELIGPESAPAMESVTTELKTEESTNSAPDPDPAENVVKTDIDLDEDAVSQSGVKGQDDCDKSCVEDGETSKTQEASNSDFHQESELPTAEAVTGTLDISDMPSPTECSTSSNVNEPALISPQMTVIEDPKSSKEDQLTDETTFEVPDNDHAQVDVIDYVTCSADDHTTQPKPVTQHNSDNDDATAIPDAATTDSNAPIFDSAQDSENSVSDATQSTVIEVQQSASNADIMPITDEVCTVEVNDIECKEISTDLNSTAKAIASESVTGEKSDHEMEKDACDAVVENENPDTSEEDIETVPGTVAAVCDFKQSENSISEVSQLNVIEVQQTACKTDVMPITDGVCRVEADEIESKEVDIDINPMAKAFTETSIASKFVPGEKADHETEKEACDVKVEDEKRDASKEEALPKPDEPEIVKNENELPPALMSSNEKIDAGENANNSFSDDGASVDKSAGIAMELSDECTSDIGSKVVSHDDKIDLINENKIDIGNVGGEDCAVTKEEEKKEGDEEDNREVVLTSDVALTGPVSNESEEKPGPVFVESEEPKTSEESNGGDVIEADNMIKVNGEAESPEAETKPEEPEITESASKEPEVTEPPKASKDDLPESSTADTKEDETTEKVADEPETDAPENPDAVQEPSPADPEVEKPVDNEPKIEEQVTEESKAAESEPEKPLADDIKPTEPVAEEPKPESPVVDESKPVEPDLTESVPTEPAATVEPVTEEKPAAEEPSIQEPPLPVEASPTEPAVEEKSATTETMSSESVPETTEKTAPGSEEGAELETVPVESVPTETVAEESSTDEPAEPIAEDTAPVEPAVTETSAVESNATESTPAKQEEEGTEENEVETVAENTIAADTASSAVVEEPTPVETTNSEPTPAEPATEEPTAEEPKPTEPEPMAPEVEEVKVETSDVAPATEEDPSDPAPSESIEESESKEPEMPTDPAPQETTSAEPTVEPAPAESKDGEAVFADSNSEDQSQPSEPVATSEPAISSDQPEQLTADPVASEDAPPVEQTPAPLVKEAAAEPVEAAPQVPDTAAPEEPTKSEPVSEEPVVVAEQSVAVASAPVDAKPTPPEVPQTESSTQGDSASSPVNDKEAESEKPSSTLAQAEKSVIDVLETMEQKLEESLEAVTSSADVQEAQIDLTEAKDQNDEGGDGEVQSSDPSEPVVTENVSLTKTEQVLLADEDGNPQVTKEIINMTSEKSSEQKMDPVVEKSEDNGEKTIEQTRSEQMSCNVQQELVKVGDNVTVESVKKSEQHSVREVKTTVTETVEEMTAEELFKKYPELRAQATGAGGAGPVTNKLVTSTTDGDAKSRTKTEQEETCSKEVTSGGDGETFTISNTSTSRTTKTVASSNLPLPPDTDEAPSTDAKATDVTEEKQKETVVPVVVKDEALPEAPTRKKPSTDSTAAAPAKATPTTSASSPTRRISRSRNGDSERRQNEEGVFQFLFGCCIGR